jgi:hypothetical protein
MGEGDPMKHEARPEREALLGVIRDVRRRWRWRVALRALAVLAGAGVLTLVAAAYALEQVRFAPSAIVAFRVVTFGVLATIGWFVFVRPLGRRVSDEQVALYLEEHEPGLDALLVSAVEAGARPAAPAGESAALVRRLVEAAVEKCREIEYGRRVERAGLRRAAVALAVIGAAAAVVYLAGPAYLRHGALALLLPARSAEAASPYRIEVAPGHATVARGADVAVTARLVGFGADHAELFTRAGAGGAFERVPLVAGEDAAVFEGTLFNLRQALDYFVEAAGVRSPVFRIEVADLPHVERLELEYVFPAYTGLSPQVVEHGGDVAVLRGTTVRVRVHATLPTPAGRIVLDDRETSALAAGPDGTLTGAFTVTRDGFYRVDLQSPAGAMVAASPQYTIDVLADQPPIVSFARPGRDLRPTPVEEVFVEAKAEDDFGVARLELVYAVNGGAERVVPLVGSRARPLKSVAAGYTFFLEELHVKPGDVVAYYARAADNDAVTGPKVVASDIYFLQVRPFRKDYRAAESQAAMAGGGAQGGLNQVGALSEQQRRIVTGTFNVVRDRDKKPADQVREDVVFLALAQGQLRERVETLVTQIETRVLQADPEMKQVADALAEAAKAMREAEAKLQARDPKAALPPEQQALAALQRAEETFRDVRVTLGNPGGGGGGAQSSEAIAEELADLFQLELDKLRNQYEMAQRGAQQAADNRTDALIERLRELARRQEQEAERLRQLAGSRAAGGAGGSAARQRQLADEVEETARQLERLSREAERPELAEAAERLREAADAMRRAAAQGDRSAFGEAMAAAERLRQAQARLEAQRADRMARQIQEALDRVQRLAAEQQAVEADVRALGRAGVDRAERAARLMDRKEAQATELADIERQLDRTAADFRRERPEAARATAQAADAIRDSKLKEKIRYSKGLVRGAPPEAAANFEEQIAADLAALEGRLREALRAAGTPERDRRAEALARARDLLRGVESMDERLRERQAAGERGAPAEARQAGQPGARGEPRQEAGAEASGRGDRGGARGEETRAGQAGEPGEGGRRGQAAQPGQSGRAPGDRTGGDPRGWGGQQTLPPERGGAWGSARPGPLGPDEVRQWRREVRERVADAEALRRDLQALGVDARDLDRLIRDLRLFDQRLEANPLGLAELQAALVERARRFEFALRRLLASTGAEALTLSGLEDAPASYRKLVEEYYRQLARERKR